MKKTVIITGSKRPNGTSSSLAKEISNSREFKCEIFNPADRKVDFCLACLYCDKDRNQNCVLEDGFQDFIKMSEAADNLVFITPIYGGNVTGTMKNFIDRTNHYFNFDKWRGKKMFLILTGCLPITEGESQLFENEKPINRIKECFEEYAGITHCDFEYLGYFRVHPDTGNVFKDYPNLNDFIIDVQEKLT